MTKDENPTSHPTPVQGEALPVVGYGFPNTAVSGHHQPLMMIRHDIPSDDQYGGKLWEPLTLHAQATAEIHKRDERVEFWSNEASLRADEIERLETKLAGLDGLANFAREIVKYGGKYEYLNMTPIVPDAYQALATYDAALNSTAQESAE